MPDITYVNKQLDTGTTGNGPETFSLNIGTRTNGGLVVGFTGAASTAAFSSEPTATYNGVSMTRYPASGALFHSGGYYFTVLFYLENPTDGTNDLVIDWEVDSGGYLFAWTVISTWFDNIKQTNPLDQSNNGQGSTDPTVSVTPTEDGELVIGSLTSVPNKTVGSGETLLYMYNLGGWYGGGSYAIQTTATTQNVDWTGTDGVWAETVITLREEAATAVDESVISAKYAGITPTDKINANETVPSIPDFRGLNIINNASIDESICYE